MKISPYTGVAMTPAEHALDELVLYDPRDKRYIAHRYEELRAYVLRLESELMDAKKKLETKRQ